MAEVSQHQDGTISTTHYTQVNKHRWERVETLLSVPSLKQPVNNIVGKPQDTLLALHTPEAQRGVAKHHTVISANDNQCSGMKLGHKVQKTNSTWTDPSCLVYFSACWLTTAIFSFTPMLLLCYQKTLSRDHRTGRYRNALALEQMTVFRCGHQA